MTHCTLILVTLESPIVRTLCESISSTDKPLWNISNYNNHYKVNITLLAAEYTLNNNDLCKLEVSNWQHWRCRQKPTCFCQNYSQFVRTFKAMSRKEEEEPSRHASFIDNVASANMSLIITAKHREYSAWGNPITCHCLINSQNLVDS